MRTEFLLPKHDGHVNSYPRQFAAQLAPRIYFVNGVRTDPQGHVNCARGLHDVCERQITGIYNQTDLHGIGDFLQATGDYAFNLMYSAIGNAASQVAKRSSHLAAVANRVKSKIESAKTCPPIPKNDPARAVQLLRKLIPKQDIRRQAVEKALGYNRAALALFKQLFLRTGVDQFIIAHSQGNLISCNALWACEIVVGEILVSRVKMFSLSSPTASIAWPATVAREEFAFANDPITWLDPFNWHFPGQGHRSGWRNHGPSFLAGAIYNGNKRNEGEMSGVVDAYGAGNVIFDRFVDRIRLKIGLPALTANRKAELEILWRNRWLK